MEFNPHQLCGARDRLHAETHVDEHFTALLIATCPFHFLGKLIREGDMGSAVLGQRVIPVWDEPCGSLR